MSYRRNDPSWNILLFGVLVAGVGAVLMTACCGPEKPLASAGGAAPAPQGQKAPSSSKLKFDPETEDHSDLAVGETVVEVVSLRSAAPIDWKTIDLLSSCDCLTARFTDTGDPKRAAVEVTFHGDKVEDIDGVVFAKELTAKPGQGEVLATYTARIVMRRIPFVMPRSIVVEKGGSGRFEVIVGQTFAIDVKAPATIFEDIHCDESKLFFDPKDELLTTEEQTLVQTRIAFDVSESARGAAFTTKVVLKFGVPAVERTVEVQWK
jgi:hypothetical protein